MREISVDKGQVLEIKVKSLRADSFWLIFCGGLLLSHLDIILTDVLSHKGNHHTNYSAAHHLAFLSANRVSVLKLHYLCRNEFELPGFGCQGPATRLRQH
jgi:hypothetical protein